MPNPLAGAVEALERAKQEGDHRTICRFIDKALTALKEAGEPVGWLIRHADHPSEFASLAPDGTEPITEADKDAGFSCVLLYTAPRLSSGWDEAIEACIREIAATCSKETARTLEQRLRSLPRAGFDFVAHLARQAAWSEKTFGPGARTKGVVDHIRKELIEIEADPLDLKEWIDVTILALDGAWRSGASPAEIIAAIVAKQTKNEGRVWPDWRTADPDKAIEHDRSTDVPPPPAQQGAK